MIFSFLKAALKDFRHVGAVSASSTYAVRAVLRNVKPEYRYIVEYGAGDGVITRALLRRLPRDGKVVAIELNPDLLSELHRIRDSRLTVLSDDVISLIKDPSLFGLPRIDAVVSGIPFSMLPAEVRREIVYYTHNFLADTGRFIVYQYSFTLTKYLKERFQNVTLRFEPRNIFPYFIMVAEKNKVR